MSGSEMDGRRTAMRIRLSLLLTLAVSVGSIHTTVLAESVDAGMDKKNLRSDSVLELLRADGHYKIFLSALEDTGLNSVLSQQGPYTIFAPTDEAFARVAHKNELMKDKELLAAVLKCHLVQFSCIESKNLAALRLSMALSSEELDFQSIEGRIKINQANVVQTDLKATDGTAHGIDAVLLPKDFEEKFAGTAQQVETKSKSDSNSKSEGNGIFGSIKHSVFFVRKKITGGGE
jgi:uncharacterized surface protein with fasciclin (FAS1) repeats